MIQTDPPHYDNASLDCVNGVVLQAAADAIVVKVNDERTAVNDVINNNSSSSDVTGGIGHKNTLSTQSSVEDHSSMDNCSQKSRSPSNSVRRSGSHSSTSGVRAKIARF